MFAFFSKKGDESASLMDKLRDRYRLVMMNDETFEEVASLKLTPLSVYIALSSLIVGTAILVVMLIVWTPLKRYIPGYGDFKRDSEISALAAKVSALDKELEAHRRYNENIRKILVGDLKDMGKEAADKMGKPLDTVKLKTVSAERMPEDELLRSEVEAGSFVISEPTSAERSGGLAFKEQLLEQIFFIPPVSGDILAAFDLRKEHYGVDISAPKNTPVKAVADGTVVAAGYSIETGYSITIQHAHNVVSLYKHNSALLKKQGSQVKAGEAIAIIGNTGEHTSGPHLHFELWHKGRPVNPANYVRFN
ncbi:MAG: M23 family metallopeptidase [Saprospiraceae bacterium]